MIDILSRRGSAERARIARSRTLLAFDYDGTLAPIVADPGAARLRPTTRRLLARVAALYPTAIVSGRSRADVARRLAGIPLRAVVGNHGAEDGSTAAGATRARSTETRMRAWRRRLALDLAGLAGVGIEDKRLSLSIHWRAAPDRRAAARAAVAAAERLAGARLVAGKCVLNVTDGRAPDKGNAVERLRRRLRCDLVAFVGDDVTDEDAFSLSDVGSMVAIRVGRSRRSRAPWFVGDQMDVDVLLERLASAREESAGAREKGPGRG